VTGSRWLPIALPLLLSACPAPPSDPPPPPRQVEIPTAPPHALGALAGGTDAAPRPDAALPGSELGPGLPLPSPRGHGPKGAHPAPAPPPEGSEDGGTEGPPDAGMAL
jgi:hypothetical protein